jgi:thioredoxin-like negative regulator of GroEL
VRAVLDLTDDSFDAHVLKAPRPVLVQFWAPWSGPCRRQRPIVEQLAAHFGPRVSFLRVNVDDQHELCGRLFITTVPFFILYLRGRRTHLVGFRREAELARVLYRAVE